MDDYPSMLLRLHLFVLVYLWYPPYDSMSECVCVCSTPTVANLSPPIIYFPISEISDRCICVVQGSIGILVLFFTWLALSDCS